MRSVATGAKPINSLAVQGLALAVVFAASVWIALANSALGDYPQDAGPALDALLRWDLSGFLSTHPDMGVVSLLVRWPFAALGGDELSVYQWGSVPCVLAAGLLGLYLARLAGRRGSGSGTQVVLVTLCLVNPLTFSALQYGHPEEILTAALAVGAVAVASQGHSGRATLLLGLAIASKQWAVIAALPVLMALPSRRVSAGAGAAAIALGLTLPTFIADPGSFLETQRSLAVESQYVGPWNAWFPLTDPTVHEVPGISGSVETYYASSFVARFSHPLIILLALALPAALALRRRATRLSGSDAMALLALLALVRCVLDPVDNIYYHEPFLLALIGCDALSRPGLPLRGLAGAAAFELLLRLEPPYVEVHLFNLVYLALAAVAAFGLGTALLQVRTDVRSVMRRAAYRLLPVQG